MMMGSVYFQALPPAFKHCLEMSEADIQLAVKVLVPAGGYCSNGSSFAVCADASEGNRFLWLSQASYNRLYDLGFFQGGKRIVSFLPMGE